MADFAGEDRGLGRFVAALAGEVVVADPLDQHCRRASDAPLSTLLPAGSVEVHGAQVLALVVDDPLGADDHHVLLHVVDLHDALDQALDVERRLGHEDDVGLAVGGAQGEVAGVPAHHLDDGDPAMALGRGADPLHARAETKTAVA